MPALFTRLGGYRVGPVEVDVDVSIDRDLQVTLSSEKVADGSDGSDHSQVEPETYTIVLGVTNVPKADLTSANALQTVGQVAGQAVGGAVGTLGLGGVQANLNTRRRDAERDIKSLVRERREIEIVTSEGVLRLFVTGVRATNDFRTGDAYVVTLTGRELLRASTNQINLPSDVSEGISGSGELTDKGPTRLGDPEAVTLGI